MINITISNTSGENPASGFRCTVDCPSIPISKTVGITLTIMVDGTDVKFSRNLIPSADGGGIRAAISFDRMEIAGSGLAGKLVLIKAAVYCSDSTTHLSEDRYLYLGKCSDQLICSRTNDIAKSVWRVVFSAPDTNTAKINVLPNNAWIDKAIGEGSIKLFFPAFSLAPSERTEFLVPIRDGRDLRETPAVRFDEKLAARYTIRN